MSNSNTLYGYLRESFIEACRLETIRLRKLRGAKGKLNLTKDRKVAIELMTRLQLIDLNRLKKIPIALTTEERELILYCLNYRFFPVTDRKSKTAS